MFKSKYTITSRSKSIVHKLKPKIILIYLTHSQIIYKILILDFQNILPDFE